MPPPSLHSVVRLGHVHLMVADLVRPLRFWRDVIGFAITQRMGSQPAFPLLGSIAEGLAPKRAR